MIDAVMEMDLMESAGYELCFNCYEYFDKKKKGKFCSKECEAKYLIKKGRLSIGKSHLYMTRDEIARCGFTIEYF